MRLVLLADGSSIHTVRWADWFASRGHEVHLFTDHPYQGSATVRVHDLSQWAPPGADVLPRLKRSPRALRRLRSEVAALRPHVVHGHFLLGYGHLAALVSGPAPLALTAWGSDVYLQPQLSATARVLTRWAVRRAMWVTADSAHLLSAAGPRPGTGEVISFGVDTDLFQPLDKQHSRAVFGLPPDVPIVLSTRSLRPIYNIELVVDAFAEVVMTEPAAVLVIKDFRGAASTIAAVRARVEAVGIAQRVHWLDEVAHDQLPALYACADVVVSLASSDSAPVTVLESLSCEVPVVASDLQSIREWLEPRGPEHLAVPLDAVPVAEAIACAITSVAGRQERLTAARQRVVDRADHNATMAVVESRYRLLAARR